MPLVDGAGDDGRAVGTGGLAGSELVVGVVSPELPDGDMLGSGLRVGSALEAGTLCFAVGSGSGFS